MSLGASPLSHLLVWASTQAILFPKTPSFCDLRNGLVVEERELAGLGSGDGSGQGLSTETRNFFRKRCAKKVRFRRSALFSRTQYLNHRSLNHSFPGVKKGGTKGKVKRGNGVREGTGPRT